jgi:hypothetical protein
VRTFGCGRFGCAKGRRRQPSEQRHDQNHTLEHYSHLVVVLKATGKLFTCRRLVA